MVEMTLLLLLSSIVLPVVDDSSSITNSPSSTSLVLHPLPPVDSCSVKLPLPNPPVSPIWQDRVSDNTLLPSSTSNPISSSTFKLAPPSCAGNGFTPPVPSRPSAPYSIFSSSTSE